MKPVILTFAEHLGWDMTLQSHIARAIRTLLTLVMQHDRSTSARPWQPSPRGTASGAPALATQLATKRKQRLPHHVSRHARGDAPSALPHPQTRGGVGAILGYC